MENILVICSKLATREEALAMLEDLDGKKIGSLPNTSPQEASTRDFDATLFAFYEETSLAEREISVIMPIFSFIVLINLDKKKLFLYKGPEVDELEKVYLPDLFKLYEDMDLGENPGVLEIIDHRKDEKMPYFYKIGNSNLVN